MEFDMTIRCVGCGQSVGAVRTMARTQQDGRRLQAFFGAFRCGPCWVARQQDRELRSQNYATVQHYQQPEPDGRRYGYSGSPRRGGSYQEQHGTIFDTFGPHFGG